MLDYYTVARIKETLARAEAAGINTTIMRSDAHIHRLLREYYNEGGQIQWIAQVPGDRSSPDFQVDARRAVAAGAKAAYLHGGLLDACFADRDAEGFARLVEIMRQGGVPVGAAGHSPEAHLWAHELDRQIGKPCIGYKIMAAGRVDARAAFEYAFANIKPGDCVNVGVYRGDNDDMVEENVRMVEEILGG